MKREKCIVNNVEWKIPNDNIARDSHLEEMEYTDNKYTLVISEQGIPLKDFIPFTIINSPPIGENYLSDW